MIYWQSFLSLLPNVSGKERSGMCMNPLWIFYLVKKWMPLKQKKKGMLGELIQLWGVRFMSPPLLFVLLVSFFFLKG